MPYTPTTWVDDSPPWLEAANLNKIENGIAALEQRLASVKDYGAVGDGVTDDTAAIQEAIDENAVVYFPPCTGGYGISVQNGLELDSDKTLIGCGYPGRIKRIGGYTQAGADQFCIAFRHRFSTGPTAKNITVSNLYIDGNAATWPGFTTQGDFSAGCFFFRNNHADYSQNIAVERCQVVDWPGQFSKSFGLDGFRWQNNYARNIRRGAFEYFGKNKNGVIVGNIIDGASDDGIAINGTTGSSLNIAPYMVIANNYIRNVMIAENGGKNIVLRSAQYASITGNVGVGGIGGVYLSIDVGSADYPTSDVVLADNSLSEYTETGIRVWGAGNHNNLKIVDNNVRYAPRSGIEVDASDQTYTYSHIQVDGNTVVDCGADYAVHDDYGSGIYLDGAPNTVLDDISVSRNTIVRPRQEAIRLNSPLVKGLKVNDNQITDPNESNSAATDAISLKNSQQWEATNNMIRDSRVTKRCRYGIYVDPSCADGKVEGTLAHHTDFLTAREYIGSSSTRIANLDNPRAGIFVEDDFITGHTTQGSIGALGWAFGIGSVANLAGEASRPGIIRYTSSATPLAPCYLATRVVTSDLILPAELFHLTYVLRLTQNDSDTKLRVGMMQNNNDPVNNAIYFETAFDETDTWRAVTRNGVASETRTPMSAITAGAWIRFVVRRKSATEIAFSINDGAETVMTATIPTAALTPGIQLVNRLAATKTYDLDYFQLRVVGLSR